MKAIVIIGFILITSPKFLLGQKTKIQELLLDGYSIGDTITNEFILSKKLGPYFSIFKLYNDSAFKVHTVGNHISAIYFSYPKHRYEKSLAILKENLDTPKIYYIGDTITGVKLKHNIERYVWIDKINNTEYDAYLNLDSIQQGFISITNDTISESLMFRFIEGYGDEEIYEEVKFDFE